MFGRRTILRPGKPAITREVRPATPDEILAAIRNVDEIHTPTTTRDAQEMFRGISIPPEQRIFDGPLPKREKHSGKRRREETPLRFNKEGNRI